MEDMEEGDFLLYVLLGAAVVYFLYKNNVFGAPGAVPGISSGASAASQPLLPSSSSGAAASAAPATAQAAPIPYDFGLTDTSWSD